MVENLGRKLILIGALLAVSLGLLLRPEPFNMGLDLAGGTRMVWRVDFEQAVKDGVISADENRADLLNQLIDIISKRVDPKGVREPVIRSQGSDRVIIELPGSTASTGQRATGSLAEQPAPLSNYLVLAEDDPSASGEFPAGGGVVQIGQEKIRYEARSKNRLTDIDRGYLGTQDFVEAHPVGSTVTLVSTNAIQNAIENLGQLSFNIRASDADLDLVAEREKLEAWVAENPDTPIANFNSVPADLGGPDARILWYPFSPDPEVEDPGALARTRFPVLRGSALTGAPDGESWTFTGADLGRVYFTQDRTGYPAVGFEMRSDRRTDFGDFTEEHEDRQMAIVLNDEIVSAPVIEGKLPGGGIIRGRFKADQVRDLITVLRTGSLKIKPILEAEEKVGPTLGASYVKRGLYGGLLALGAVVVFMVAYYKRLGIYAVVSLTATLLMLMGGLSFLQATLTLPGIAGIILTVGMAVDANILIFDRVREEMDKGRNLIQASKNGFEHAMSAILDANITTFLTALILYNVGTGPIRGFAVTLSIGVATSVFAALVITRVLVHMHLEKKGGKFSMGTWLVEAKYDFLSKRKVAIAGSLAAIVAGVAYFAILPNDQKFGIDFLGGSTVQFRTREYSEVADMRERISTIPGDIGRTAEVKPILSSAGPDGGYRSFRATFKSAGGEDAGNTFQTELRTALSDVLQEDPVEITLSTDETGTGRARVNLHFEESHDEESIRAQLATAGLSEAVVTQGTVEGNYDVTAATAVQDVGTLAQAIEEAFTNTQDSDGTPFVLAAPIPETSVVGAQVVGELKDKAILALLISLFVIVMYIRVRFAEYSYGFAAVAALVHDVLITLGVISALMSTGLVQIEINLPLIAAFLTIIGYSLNDTIVLFDRVRENLPRVEGGLEKVLNVSINQTLSRTILTSMTTFLAVILLFAFNVGTGNVIEGFSLAMVIGVVVGTYSSIFIAAPAFLWLETRAQAKVAAEKAKEDSASKAAATVS